MPREEALDISSGFYSRVLPSVACRSPAPTGEVPSAFGGKVDGDVIVLPTGPASRHHGPRVFQCAVASSAVVVDPPGFFYKYLEGVPEFFSLSTLVLFFTFGHQAISRARHYQAIHWLKDLSRLDDDSPHHHQAPSLARHHGSPATDQDANFKHQGVPPSRPRRPSFRTRASHRQDTLPPLQILLSPSHSPQHPDRTSLSTLSRSDSLGRPQTQSIRL